MSIKSDVLSYRIPCGYMIVCSSWENDGDHYQTNVVGGLTKESAQLKYDLLNAITNSGCENIYEHDALKLEPLKNAVLEVANNHGYVIDTELGWERYSFEKKNISEIYENGEESNGFNEESSNPEELYDEG